MKKLVVLSVLGVLAGCAQTQWTHPTKNQTQFQMDSAYCQNESMRSVQQQAAAPVVPAYTPPTQYDTSCSRSGNYVNCSTTSQGNYAAQLAQQNAQNMAQAGANIGTGIARQQYVENCMMSLGYRKQQVTSQAQSNSPSMAQQYKLNIDELNASFRNNVCGDERFKPLFLKSSCSANEISLNQLADNEKISESEKELLNLYTERNREFLNGELDIINKYMASPMKDEISIFRRKQFNEAINERIELIQGKITWGEYNKRRTAAANRGARERMEIIKKY